MQSFENLLKPLEGQSPCGPDCEYESDFLALTQALAGKPEQQFGDTVIAGVEPDWVEVDRISSALLTRSKDLRLVTALTLANTHMHGLPAFAAGIKLALNLCEQYWDEVHPRIEVDGELDPYLRMNAISAFSGSESSGDDRLVQALRRSVLVRQPLTITFRDVELALSKAPQASYSLTQIESALAASEPGNPNLVALREARNSYQSLRALLDERVSTDEVPDMERLSEILKLVVPGLDNLLAKDDPGADAVSAPPGAAGSGPSGGASGGSGMVQSRDDARRALERVCEYLERNEPSNPASLFARRAQRLLNMPFMELMRELSPDSMAHLEMLTGAQPPSGDE